MCDIAQAFGISRRRACRVIVRPPASSSPDCARRADARMRSGCRRQGPAPGFPETLHGAPTRKVVLRPREYYRFTPASGRIACVDRRSKAAHRHVPIPYVRGDTTADLRRIMSRADIAEGGVCAGEISRDRRAAVERRDTLLSLSPHRACQRQCRRAPGPTSETPSDRPAVADASRRPRHDIGNVLALQTACSARSTSREQAGIHSRSAR